MYNGHRIIALIPARGGSKGIPRKNIRSLNGKPLIAWSIDGALGSKYIDKVIVSTDDAEISGISSKYGAQVPFVRPPELASDQAKGIDVVMHAVDWCEQARESFDILILLQPTSPLRTKRDIDAAIEFLVSNKEREAVVSVCEVEHHPFLSNTLSEDLSMETFFKKEFLDKNRQEYPDVYRINGAIYVAYISFLKKNRTFFAKGTFAFIMSREQSIDIDSEHDFRLAEILISELKQKDCL